MKELVGKILPNKAYIRKNWPDLLLIILGFGGVFCVLVFALVVLLTISSLHL